MTLDMQPETVAAIRAELAAIGTGHSGLQRRQRRARVTASLVGVVAVAVSTSAAAVVVAGLPGTTTTTRTGAITTVTRTGPALVDLGRAPDGAGAVVVDIACISRTGAVQVATEDGTTAEAVHCGHGGTGRLHVTDGALPADGSSRFAVDASPGTTWRAVLQYATSVTSAWATNARGQTYGVENAHGHPDLVPITTDDGRTGWAPWDEVVDQSAPVVVTESDGVTVIGRSTAPDTSVPEVPFDRSYLDDLDTVATPTP